METERQQPQEEKERREEGGERKEAAEIDERNHEKAEEREREVFQRIREMVADVKEKVTEVVWEKPRDFVKYCRKEGLSGLFKDFMERFSGGGEGVPDDVKTEAAQAAIEGEDEEEGKD